MPVWHVDEGLAVLIAQWKRKHPRATVYTIGDRNHSTDPDVSQHAPEPDGEVDAGDFMTGNGVTLDDLADLHAQLMAERDRRLLMMIFKRTIVSSVVRPWILRPYGGAYHGHLHVSVNDRHEGDTTPWDLEADVRDYTMRELPAGLKLPELRLGDEDAPGKTAYVRRVQQLLKVDDDGVYGAKTAAALKARMAGATGWKASSTNGTKLYLPEWRVLYALW